LWKYDVDEYSIEKRSKKAEERLNKEPIISVYGLRMSQPIFLDKCCIYQMEVFMGETHGGDHASVGMRKPSGEYERPIPGTRLFWTKPGTILY